MSHSKKSKNHQQDTLALSTKAKELLEQHRYKKAIEAYKQLIAQEQRTEWFEALAQAYLGRARELSKQGLYQEAAVFWENRAKSCHCEDHLGEYLRWLLLAKRYAKAASVLFNPKIALQPSEKQQFNEYLAAILLTQDIPEINAVLPADSNWNLHKTLIKQAIDAYSQGNDPQEYLKQVPFRSPYRDLRLILKAMHEGTENQLQISPNSVYYQFVELLQVRHQTESVRCDKIATLSEQQFEFISYSYGWRQEQTKLISNLRKAHNATPQQLFRFIIDNKTLLGEIYSQNACLRALPYYPDGIKEYQHVFTQVSDVETAHLFALANELKTNIYDSVVNWYKMVALLSGSENRGVFAKLPEKIDHITLQQRYEVAIILRHIFELMDKAQGVFEDVRISLLTDSLHFDPTDKLSYIKLIHYFSQDKKQYQHWVQAAIKQFPSDIEILLLGIQAAIASRAFKKAEQFAKTILKYDPINVKAKQFLLFSHLSSARKQIKAKKYHLARAELEHAEKAERISQRTGLVQINQGWLSVLEAEVETAIAYFTTAFQIITTPILQVICLTVEGKNAKLTDTQVDSWVKQLIQFKPNAHFSPAVINEVVDIIKYYQEQSLPDLAKTLRPFIKIINNSAKYNKLTQHEVQTLCEKLAETKLFKTLKEYATQGLKAFPHSSLLIYYHIFAKTEGDPRALGFDYYAEFILTSALSDAHSQGDKLAAGLIMSFLHKKEELYPLHNPRKEMEFNQKIVLAAQELGINLDQLVPGSADFRKILQILESNENPF